MPEDFIRICPDWNVKFIEKITDLLDKFIRICPDWNVKDIAIAAFKALKED